MTAEVKLTAYDKQTELLAAELAVPRKWIGYARRVAGVPSTDPLLLGVYPLTPDQAAQIARKAALKLDPTEYDFCLEAFAPDRQSRASAA
jgi:hypothetical protein